MRKRAFNDVSVSRIIERDGGGETRNYGFIHRATTSQKREISGNFRALKRFRQWRPDIAE